MSKTILLIDDSMFMFEEMKYLLRDSAYELVGHCTCGEDAVGAYEKLHPDVVIMDIILPGIDGIEATQQIMSRWPDARVVVLSSLAYDETIENAHRLGALGYLFKPLDRDIVLECLDQIKIPE